MELKDRPTKKDAEELLRQVRNDRKNEPARQKREQAERRLTAFLKEAKEAGFSEKQIKFLQKYFAGINHEHDVPFQLMRF